MKYAICCAEDISMGCGYISTYLKNQGHDVKLFFDPCQYDRAYAKNPILAKAFSLESYLLYKIRKYKPDVCLFSCVTATYQWALNLACKVKKQTGCKIIFGGVHPTLVPEEVRKHAFIDDVVVGDGIKYFGGEFNPDEIWPDREMFFKELPSFHRKYQLFMTSFGCPFNCTYCSNEEIRKAYGQRYVRRSVQGCIKELKHLKATGMKYVLFIDDILTCDKKFLLSFLPEYKKEIGLPFTCFGHPKFIDEEVTAALKDAGCHMVWIGLQTGVEQLRQQILNRPETNIEIKKCFDMLKKAGIKIMIDHIFGIPFESEMTNDYSCALYNDLKPDVINCYNLLYFPKSKIIEHALRFGYLIPSDIQRINEGTSLRYHTGHAGNRFYDTYHKAMVTIPLGNITWELLPTIIIKLLVHTRAGRWWMPVVMIQNEVHFTVRAVLKKLRLI